MKQPAFGMNWNLAQRLPFPPYGSFWLVPGNRFLCLLEQRGRDTVNQACAKTERVLAHGLFLAFLGAGAEKLVYGARRFVIGVVPDRTHKVFIMTDDSKVAVSITENAFVRRDGLTAPPDRLVLAEMGTATS
jgi:hypothetical protein